MKKLITLLISAALLTACAGVPSSGPIKFGNDINNSAIDQFIQVIGRPPTKDMSAAEIAKGFLAALADSRNNYSIARQYLTDEASKEWLTETGVNIYDSTGLTVTEGTDQVTVSAGKFGDIDQSGYLTLAAPNTQLTRSFSLAKNDQGQLRINKIANGVLLSANDVQRSFKGYPIYFMSPSKSTLVADSALVPQSLTGSATALVQALLNGPSTQMRLSVFNSFPTGTKLTYGSVPVTDGVATVDLTNQVLSADQTVRTYISAQLVWTLSALPNVSAVEIKVSGQPLSVTGASSLQTTKDWKTLNPSQFNGSEFLHFVKDNSVVASDLNGVTKTVASMPKNVAVKLGDVTGLTDGTSIAGVSADNRQIFMTTGKGGEFEKVATGSSLSVPSWDRSGNIYFSEYGVGIQKINAKHVISPVTFDSTNVASEKQVKQIIVAKDGIRVAVVISDGSVDRILYGSLVSNDLITRIVGLRYADRTINSVQDVVWQTPISLAVLGSDQSGGTMIFDVDISSGQNTSIAAPLSAQRIASSLAKQLYIGSVAGAKMTIAKSAGANWADITDGASPYFAE